LNELVAEKTAGRLAKQVPEYSLLRRREQGIPQAGGLGLIDGEVYVGLSCSHSGHDDALNGHCQVVSNRRAEGRVGPVQLKETVELLNCWKTVELLNR